MGAAPPPRRRAGPAVSGRGPYLFRDLHRRPEPFGAELRLTGIATLCPHPYPGERPCHVPSSSPSQPRPRSRLPRLHPVKLTLAVAAAVILAVTPVAASTTALARARAAAVRASAASGTSGTKYSPVSGNNFGSSSGAGTRLGTGTGNNGGQRWHRHRHRWRRWRPHCREPDLQPRVVHGTASRLTPAVPATPVVQASPVNPAGHSTATGTGSSVMAAGSSVRLPVKSRMRRQCRWLRPARAPA